MSTISMSSLNVACKCCVQYQSKTILGLLCGVVLLEPYSNLFQEGFDRISIETSSVDVTSLT